MTPVIKNFFADLPSPSGHEDILTLVQTDRLRVERIVSNGQRSPDDFWYDQEKEEWVILLQGTASLRFEDGSVSRLKAGDYVLIGRRAKHRVEETSSDAVWLALHYDHPKQAGTDEE